MNPAFEEDATIVENEIRSFKIKFPIITPRRIEIRFRGNGCASSAAVSNKWCSRCKVSTWSILSRELPSASYSCRLPTLQAVNLQGAAGRAFDLYTKHFLG